MTQYFYQLLKYEIFQLALLLVCLLAALCKNERCFVFVFLAAIKAYLIF